MSNGGVLMSSLYVRLSCGLLCVSLTVTVATQQAQPGEPAITDGIAQIVDAWKARQATVKSFDFRMTGSRFTPEKDFTARDLRLMGAKEGTQPYRLPGKSVDVKMRLAVDPIGRMRLEYGGQ